MGAVLTSGLSPGKDSNPSVVTDKKGYHYFEDAERKVVTDPSGTYIYNSEKETIEFRISNHQKDSGLVGKINN